MKVLINFYKWLRADLDRHLFPVLISIASIITLIVYFYQRDYYNNCEKKYTVALISEYYTTYTSKTVIKCIYKIGKREKTEKFTGSMTNSFTVFPKSHDTIPYQYFLNNYFIIEYCPMKEHLVRLRWIKDYQRIMVEKIMGRIREIISPTCPALCPLKVLDFM